MGDGGVVQFCPAAVFGVDSSNSGGGVGGSGGENVSSKEKPDREMSMRC